MRHAVVIGVLASAVALGGDRAGSQVEYIGGTVYAEPVRGVIQTIDPETFEFRSRQAPLRIAYSRINLIEYGQRVARRYAMAVLISPVLILSKKRAHYLTVGYTDEQGRQQALVFRVDKNDIRAVLVSLEARTGRQVQFQDDEARKAGKG